MKQIKKIMWLPLYELFYSKIMYRNRNNTVYQILFEDLMDEVNFFDFNNDNLE